MVNKKAKLIRLIKGIAHLFQIRYRKGHRVHSPSAFEFVSMVLFDKKKYSDYSLVEQLVKKLNNDTCFVDVEEHGAGSSVFTSNHRMVKKIARHAGTEKKTGRLLYRMARYYKPQFIIELGTSLGISTLYLAKGAGESGVVQTIEANESLVKIAQNNADKLSLKNIKFYTGKFDEVLNALEGSIQNNGLVFIDGNHTYEATLRYFNFFNQRIQKGFIIIDDIYWSCDMEKAWNEIRHASAVSFDLFSVGIILKGEMLTPHHYKISF
jgi:predicted O-methyltransferase YrrM